MESGKLLKIIDNGITFVVVIVFFLASILIPFHQIFPDTEVISIKQLGWIISFVFFIDLIFRITLTTSTKLKVSLLNENDFVTYVESYFIFDFIAIIPISIFHNPSLWQLLPLIKLFSVFNRINLIRQSMIKFASFAVVVQFLYWFTQITHWISCGWLKISGIEKGKTVLSNYVSSLYWTTTTLTTVGYGDIVPTTNAEKLYASAVMIIGVGFYGYLIGSVVSVITKRDPAHEKFIANLENLSALVKYRNPPKNLVIKIKQYFFYLWKNKLSFDEDNFLKKLPPGLRAELDTFLKQDLIKNLDLFKGASLEFINELAGYLNEIIILPNEFLFHEGDFGQKVFFVIKGELVVLNEHDTHEIARIKSGDLFGEIALFKNKTRIASVKAITFCHLYSLDKASFDKLIPKYPSIAKKIEAKVLERESLVNDYSENEKLV